MRDRKREAGARPSTKECDLIPRLSKRDYDGVKGRPRAMRGKNRGREEKGRRNVGRTAKRQALVVNSAKDMQGERETEEAAERNTDVLRGTGINK